MTIYKNKYGQINLFDDCKYFNKTNDINVSVSGGADSALMLWMIFKEFSEKNIQKNLLVSTMWASKSIRDGMPSNLQAANDVVKYVSGCFPDVKYKRFIYHSDINFIPYQTQEKKTEYKKIKLKEDKKFHNEMQKQFDTLPLHIWGETSNPEKGDRVAFKMDNSREYRRDPGNPFLEQKFMNNRSRWAPFIKFTKRFLSEIYKEYHLMDLFALTESCVGLNTKGLPCKQCWWCNEKYWAFGYYDHLKKPLAICTVLTGEKYSVNTVNKLYENLYNNTSQLFDFYCYTDHVGLNDRIQVIPITNKNKKLQWYKLDFFKNNFIENEDIIIMDIDVDIIGNQDWLFKDYGYDFTGSHRWWWRWREDNEDDKFALSGTIYKFKNGEHQYIVDTFENNIEYWEEYFIKNGTTVGPVNGEQHFVQKMLIDNNTNKGYFPEKMIVKWHNDFSIQLKLERDYYKWSGNDYIENDGWNPDIRMVHYAGG